MQEMRPLVWYRRQPPGNRYTHIVKYGALWYYTWAPWWGHFEVTGAFIAGGAHDESPPGLLAVRAICDRSGSGDNKFAFYPDARCQWQTEKGAV